MHSKGRCPAEASNSSMCNEVHIPLLSWWLSASTAGTCIVSNTWIRRCFEDILSQHCNSKTGLARGKLCCRVCAEMAVITAGDPRSAMAIWVNNPTLTMYL